jgi:hypothetical protein
MIEMQAYTKVMKLEGKKGPMKKPSLNKLQESLPSLEPDEVF